jgi:hypothetical protein
MARRDISQRCRLWSLSEQSGHGPTCRRLNSVAVDPSATSAVQRSTRETLVYSITLSARMRNVSGIVSPSAFAVVRLTTKSNLVGCSTGMSAGRVPRRI